MDKTTSLRERQVKEAVERMKLLELYPAVINEFINEKVINKSEHIGILYWLDDDEKKFVEDFENEHNAVV